jgi:biopolymer transport protein ExbD
VDSKGKHKPMAEIQQSKPEEKGRSKSRRRLHIDMTPMVDLAFLLLTFFVMTSVLTKRYAMGLDMPEDDLTINRAPIPASRVLTLILDEGDKIYWYRADNPVLEATTFSPGGNPKTSPGEKS